MSSKSVQFYRKRIFRRILMITGLVILTFSGFIYDISSGPSQLNFFDVLRNIFSLLSGRPEESKETIIIFDIRMPMALMALEVGFLLSVAGAQMQTILNNPLADPFTLGIASAAGFGASLVVVLGFSLIPYFGVFAVSGNAFLFSMIASLLIYFVSRMKGATVETVVLMGIALLFTFNAFLGLMQYMASEDALARIVFWSMGSLTKASWGKVTVGFVAILVLTPILSLFAWKLSAIRLGEERAESLGVNTQKLRLMVLLILSLMTSIAVAFVGTIAFVGLVGPHMARMLVGEDQRFFLPASAFTGSLLMSLTSIVSKSLLPGSIFPIGIITSLIGVPFFISLIISRRREIWH